MSEHELLCEEKLSESKKTTKEKEKCGFQQEEKNLYRFAYICKREITWTNHEI